MSEPAQPADRPDDASDVDITEVVIEGLPPGSLGAGAEQALAWALRRLDAQLSYEITFVCQLSDRPRAVRLAAANTLVVTDADPAIDRCRRWLTAGTAGADPSPPPNVARELPPRSPTQFEVPLLFSDGSLYGMFSGTSRPADEQIDHERLHLIRAVASATIDRIEQAEQDRLAQQRRR